MSLDSYLQLQTNVNSRMYEEITYDYPVAAAKAFASLADPFKFVMVSGMNLTLLALVVPGLSY